MSSGSIRVILGIHPKRYCTVIFFLFFNHCSHSHTSCAAVNVPVFASTAIFLSTIFALGVKQTNQRSEQNSVAVIMIIFKA